MSTRIIVHNASPYDEELFMIFMESKFEEGFKETTIVITEPAECVYHIDIQGYVMMSNGMQSRSYTHIVSDETMKKLFYEHRGTVTGKKTGII